MIEEPGFKYLLSEKYSQDPLEEHFAKHRRSGGSNENPTLYSFGNQELALNQMNSSLIADLRGNTRGNNNPVALNIRDKRKLPTKKKKNE